MANRRTNVVLADESDDFRDAVKGLFVGYSDLSSEDDAVSDSEDSSDTLAGEASSLLVSTMSVTIGGMGGGRTGLLKRPSAWNLAQLAELGEQSDGAAGEASWQSPGRSHSIMDFLTPCSTGREGLRPRSFSYEGMVERPVPSLISLKHSYPVYVESQDSFEGLASRFPDICADDSIVLHFGYEEVDESDVLKSAISAYYADDFEPDNNSAPAHRSTQPEAECASAGLRASEVKVAQRVYGANQLPPNLPDVPLATCRAIAYVFALRPAALIAGTLASSHLAWGIVPLVLESAAHRPPRALLMAAAMLGLSASVVGTSRFLEHYLSAFDRLREHVLLAQYALHRVRKGEEEEEFALVRREGVKAWVPCSALVPGDVIHLEEGRVPADCKLIEADNLKISCPIAEVPFQSNVPRVFSTAWWSCGKGAAAQVERCRLPKAHALGASEDSEQIALSTSIVTSGKATAIVTRTGKCSGAYLLLSRLSSLSLLEVVALYVMGGGPHQGGKESVN